jgi:CubicO group peptidase (beta-lactamase class C family)
MRQEWVPLKFNIFVSIETQLMKYLFRLMAVAAILTALPIKASSQAITPAAIDQLVENTLKTFQVPGIAVGIVKDGQLIFAKGYGVRSLKTGKPVDEHTLFGIASNTKAFTTTALGILVDEGKLKWDDKVLDYIPGFRLYDPYVTQDFTIRDLLTHRSGMGLGAGDLMIWPDGSDFTRADIIHNLRYLKQVSPFRSKYDYDNNLYIIAGEVVAKISGMSWEDFVQTRILQPLGMTGSATSFVRLKDTSDIIDAHAVVNGKVQVVERSKGELMNAAGGIYSSVSDLGRWVIMHLNKGIYGPGNQTKLVSQKVHQDLWTPQTLMGVATVAPYNSHFAAYGLGFRLADVKGFLEVSHTGGLAGMVTQITMYPELNLGIIVLTNQQVGAAFTAIANQIKDSYIGVSGMDWVKLLSENVKRGDEEAARVTAQVWDDIQKQSAAATRPEPALYAGTYRDPWFGEMVVEQSGDKLKIRSKRSPGLAGELIFYRGQTFVAKWYDRSMDADAFVLFQTGFDGKVSGMTMKAISPATDFSFDFQDLDFKRTADKK